MADINIDNYSKIITSQNLFFQVYLKKNALTAEEYATGLTVYCEEMNRLKEDDDYRKFIDELAEQGESGELFDEAKRKFEDIDQFTRFLLYEEALLARAGVSPTLATYLVDKIAFLRSHISEGFKEPGQIRMLHENLTFLANVTCEAAKQANRSGPERRFIFFKKFLGVSGHLISFANGYAPTFIPSIEGYAVGVASAVAGYYISAWGQKL